MQVKQLTPQGEAEQKKVPAKKATKPKAKAATKYFTKEGYEVKEEERDYVHVVTSRFTVQRGTFDKEVAKTPHILDPKMWLLVRKVWGQQGMKFEEMLHYPLGTPEGFWTPEEDKK